MHAGDLAFNRSSRSCLADGVRDVTSKYVDGTIGRYLQVEDLRPIRDEIAQRVGGLLAELLSAPI